MRSSDNHTIMGNLEIMMKDIGCYIRYNFNLRLIMVDGDYPEEKPHQKVDSGHSCAELCFGKFECSSWSYQIATKLCFFFTKANETMIHPEKNVGSLQQTSSEHLGWVSGLKACRGIIEESHNDCNGTYVQLTQGHPNVELELDSFTAPNSCPLIILHLH